MGSEGLSGDGDDGDYQADHDEGEQGDAAE
jgi:hypothetical protein